MLVARGHAQILVAEKQGDSMNISALHSQPAYIRMAQIVETKVFNTKPFADAEKRHAGVCGLMIEA